MTKTNGIEREKVLLIEFSEVPDVKEIVPVSGRPMEVRGAKVHRLYDHNSKLLTAYDGEADRTDLSCLSDRGGHFLVTVSAPSDKVSEHHWYRWNVGETIDNDSVHLLNGIICTPEEVELLDEMYPEYKANAF